MFNIEDVDELTHIGEEESNGSKEALERDAALFGEQSESLRINSTL